MEKALLDTDALSEILKGKNQSITKRSTEYLGQFERLTISTVTVMEIVKGFQKVGRENKLQQFLGGLAALEVLPLTTEAAVAAGRIYGDLERAGEPIGRADPMIAGVAIAHGLVLVTGNVAHYDRVRKLGHALRIENWVRA